MALTLRTPGVYVVETSLLPPSVAEVETAVPAFIGYTKIAGAIVDGFPVPVRITSMLEYETIFGFAENQIGIAATVTGNDIQITGPSALNKSKFLMYYSLQMFFANGGGPCYIVSVGAYSGTPLLADLEKGLKAIEKQDEPTLLLFPDATSLSDINFYSIYKSALAQCNKLQDRFTIIDTYNDNPITSLSYNPIEKLRNGINSDPVFLKYGAAYYPFLNTLLSYQYDDAAVDVKIMSTTDYTAQSAAIAASIDTTAVKVALNNLVDIIDNIDPSIPTVTATEQSSLVSSLHAVINEITGFKNIFSQAIPIANKALEDNPANPNNGGVVSTLSAFESWITTGLDQPTLGITVAINIVNGTVDTSDILDAVSSALPTSVYSLLGVDAANVANSDIVIDVQPSLTLTALTAALALVSTGSVTNTKLDLMEANNNILYNQIKVAIGGLSIKLPPSSSMAGVYARVDTNSGVWTAPANVGLNYVISPSYMIDNEQQGDLNETSTGKSVNAIRTFTGRGTLVWGARTLTGNDNEWKYISVRRFFIFAEESIRKATEPFVFQSNDANTWVKVQGMIESFLTQQWKAGALAGGKAEQAFYVRVGLGSTMTSDDVLNGRMIIEIGMAVVRPAEFIVLKFTHKMQEA